MITLEQAQAGCTVAIDRTVIEEFRKNSLLLDMMEFDDTIIPSAGGTLTYKYLREEIPAEAQFRELNTEYTPQEATRREYSADVKIFGGSYEIDRVLENTSAAIGSEVAYQTKKKIKATVCLFHHTLINGDSDINHASFDGLDKALRGAVTEKNCNSVIDLSTADRITENYMTFMELMDETISELCERPSCIMANTSMINKLKQVARRAGYLTRSEDAFGRSADGYDGIPFMDMKYYPHKETSGGYTERPIIPISVRKFGTADNETTVTGLTDIYFPVLDREALHGITAHGDKLIRQYPPDFRLPGAVKKGEVEMLAAIALKSSRGAGVLRNVKIK